MRKALLPALLLTTLAIYHPALHGDFLWDDDAHVTRAELRSAAGLRHIWFDLGATQQYYPAVHSAFWIQHRLFGDATLGYHLTTAGLHAVAAFLIAVVLRRLAVPSAGAALAALIFAVHPVHVESVAWITELKNTLSGVFYLGAALAYVRFDESRQARPYATALALFVLALSSKSVTATLPAVLLIVFWWRRGRLTWRRDVLPLAPFFALGAGAGLLTVWVERAFVGAVGSAYNLTMIERLLVAGRAFWFYLGKLVWPVNLTFIYPKWPISQADLGQYLYPAGVVMLLAGLWAVRRWSRAPLAAALCYGAMLFPALGLFNVYPFRYSYVADHFQYLASIAVIALGAAALAGAATRWPGWRAWSVRVGAAALTAFLAVMTWTQSGAYTDNETLYRQTLRRNPSATMASINLALQYLNGPAERWPQAVGLLEAAVALDPQNAEAHVNLGAARHRIGRFEEAAGAYRSALRLTPRDGQAWTNLAMSLEQVGRLAEALDAYREALRLAPASSEALTNMGRILLASNETLQAAAALEQAVRLAPENGSAHYLLGTVQADLGALEKAIVEYTTALRDATLANSPELHNDLGVALARAGRLDEAAGHFKEALRLKPEFDAARTNLRMTGK
jgi:Flp pilus assembly protein TadD